MRNRFLQLACGAATLAAVGFGVATAPQAIAGTTLAEPAETSLPEPVLDLGTDPALKAAVERAVGRDPVLTSFYEGRDFAPLWVTSEGALHPRAKAVLAAIEGADDHALPVRRYDGARGAVLAGDRWDGDRELAFTRAYLSYARDITSGSLEPRRIDREIKTVPPRPEEHALLSAIASSADPAGFLQSLIPASAEYARLLAELAAMRRIAATPEIWGDEVPRGASLKEGSRSARVVQLRERLAAMGDLRGSIALKAPAMTADETFVAANDVTRDVDEPSHSEAPDPMRFDASLSAAVRAFQARHGLNTDGVVGPATLAQINASPAFRADQIAVNLERIRWLNRDLGQRHVMVNIAGFMMNVVEDGRSIFESRVVVGKRRHRTPEFSDEMEHMVVNPTWFVPRSIAVNEILPKLQEDPGYLDAKNMTLRGADPYEVDWTTITPGSFPGQIRQAPGPGNALGRVKFMFPNDHAIYLHDTPSRRLFARDVRSYSHGCVRVEKPLEFAHLLMTLQMDGIDDPDATFNRWLDAGRERYVHLERHLPVHLTYRTAWVDAAGVTQFRGDIYGRDQKVIDALREAGVALIGG